MKKTIDPAISEAAKALQKLAGEKAGIARWEGKSKEEKASHAEMMRKAMIEKLTPEKRKAIGEKLKKGREAWLKKLSAEDKRRTWPRESMLKGAAARWGKK